MMKNLLFVGAMVSVGLLAGVAEARGLRGGCPGGNCGARYAAPTTAYTHAPSNEVQVAKDGQDAAKSTAPTTGEKQESNPSVGQISSAPRRLFRRR